jgi:vacuolar protein sorting-associated protein 53
MQDVEDVQRAILELFEKIHDIKARAAQSERMVNEICHDIKKLDCAKTHLQSSITSLKRLQMLLTAVGQLEVRSTLIDCCETSRRSYNRSYVT